MSNIKSITGETLSDGKTPNEMCVKGLEEMLEMARSGEIVGIAGAVQFHDNSGGYHFHGHVGSYSVLGALQVGLHALVLDHVEDDRN
jgi:hypothetical protein